MKSLQRSILIIIVTSVIIMIQSCAQVSYNTLNDRDRHNIGMDRDYFGVERDVKPAQVNNHPRGEEPETYPVSEPQISPAAQNVDGAFRFEKLIRRKARRYQVDYYLLLALVQAESSGNPRARSSANCRGLVQLHINTARQYRPDISPDDLYDPELNLDIGARHMFYLQKLINRHFPGANLSERILLLSSAWNAGWGSVIRAGGVPDIHETRTFTRRVLKYYKSYRWGKTS